MRHDGDAGAEMDRRRVLQLLSELMVALRPCRHGPDFASVLWYGVRYTFTAAQARAVAVLWEAWRNGTPDVRQETLLEAAGCCGRMRSLFQDSPAWGTMIVAGESKGLFRLAEPAMREKSP